MSRFGQTGISSCGNQRGGGEPVWNRGAKWHVSRSNWDRQGIPKTGSRRFCAAAGSAEYHRFSTLRARWRGGGFGLSRSCGWGDGGTGRRGLDGSDEGEQLGAVHQTDGLPLGETLGVPGEIAGSDDNGFIGIFSNHQAEHFADDRSANGNGLPLLTLNQRGAAGFAQNQVDAAIGTLAQGKIHLIPLPPVGFGNEKFKLLPWGGADGFEAGLFVNQPTTVPAEPK